MSGHGNSRMGGRFLPPQILCGWVVDLPENGKPTLKFLDQRPGEVFMYRSDMEQVERKYIFRRRLRVELKGKNGFSVAEYGSIEKDYEEFKKKYCLKGKVRSYVVEGKEIVEIFAHSIIL